MRTSTVAILFLGLCTASLAVPHPAEAAKRASAKAPTVELVTPMRVNVGGTIVLRGRNFSSRRVRNTVVFRGRRTVLAKPLAARTNRLVVKVPARVYLLLRAQDGKAIPTRLRLRVLTRAKGRQTGPNQSPIVVPRREPVITSGPSGSTSNRTATFAFSSATATSFTCRLDGGDWHKCASPASYSDLGAGEHRFSVRSHNADGNAYTGPTSRSWTIIELPAADAPDVEISSGPAATSASTTATFSFSSTQTGSFECSIDLEPFSACTSPHSYSDIAPGEHEFRVRVDNANGSDVDTWSWVVTSPGSEEVNVAVDGTSTDGLNFEGSTTGGSEPSDFVTFEASLAHDPLSGSDCVPASGTWSYFDANGDLAAEFTQDSSVDGLYCPASDSYSLYWRQVGGGTTDTGNFTLVYDPVADTFTSQQNGRYTP